MRLIYLTQGQAAKVDDADYEWLCQWKWHAFYAPNTRTYYAKRAGPIPGHLVSMSRSLLGITDSKVQVDHRNGDTLDNQRDNLRVASNAQNTKNRKRHKNNTSGVKGVDRHEGKWRARIMAGGKSLCLGHFNTAEEAHEAYKAKASELHGEFARF